MKLQTPGVPVAAIHAASRRTEVIEAMRGFYAQTDGLIAAHKPVCWNRGLCCRFQEFGHRLFVTPLEAAFYLAGVGAPSQVCEATCPHAHARRCGVRFYRPLGCRIFYCESSSIHWQGPLTEERLMLLRRWHEQYQVPYVYAEWTSVLQALSN